MSTTPHHPDRHPSPAEYERTLPHSLEAEKGMLGSMLIAPTEVVGDYLESGVGEPWFYWPSHQSIFAVLVERWNAQQPADVITLTQTLRDRNLLDAVGGPSFITHLFTFTPTSANASFYREIVREKFLARRIIAVGTEYASRAYDESDQAVALLDEAEAAVLAIRTDLESAEPETGMKEGIMGAIEAVEQMYERRGAITGLSTGFKALDRMSNGLQAAEMTVIAARPSMGKTAFAMNIAEHVAVNLKLPVAIFSLEMSAAQLHQRLLCSRARVNLSDVRQGLMGERDFQNLTTAASKLAGCPMYIDETPGLSINALRAKARRLHLRRGIRLIVIDYLQLMRSTSRRAQDNRQLEIAEISSGIKALAKELKLPIIVLAQLNRNPEARKGGKPKLSDLRESGSIEQDADTVGLLWRSEYYAEGEQAKEDASGEAMLEIAKQRNGPVGDVKLTFLKQYARFEDRAEEPS